VLLRHGTSRVVAIDVGHDQLAPELQTNPRVLSFEGINAREVTMGELRELTGIADLEFQLVVADLSFISVTLVLPALVKVAPTADFVLLIKPQFEVGKQSLSASGIVSDHRLRAQAIKQVVDCCNELGLGVLGLERSELPGTHGNIEYLIWVASSERPNQSKWTGQGGKMSKKRLVLLVSHTARDEAIAATLESATALLAAGITPVMTKEQLTDTKKIATGEAAKTMEQVLELGSDCQETELELAVVLGGDGTILKAAEIVRESQTPLLGINLGHVGFLAESEKNEIGSTIERVANRDYLVKERLTLDVSVLLEGKEVYRSWALNEAAVEKSAREKMLEVVVEVDSRPLSSFGCDGIVMSTPTGSTAYAFSAGGPVVWPSVDALLLVPLSAHALFARPLVISPGSLLAVEVLQRSPGNGVLWCDGRRTTDLPAGARVEVRKSDKSVKLARLNQGPFTNRLVKKFSLPVEGWRGPDSKKA
jgi:NAD+ kinase